MSLMLEQLEPKSIWENFEALNAIPRASKKEERVIQFMIDFGLKLNLETQKDAVGNVIIRKPASVGMEKHKTVVLQSHLDMVHQKNNDTVFDFDSEGISMWIDGDWVRAEGTTLGADNGIGVAAIMGLLAASHISHPALEALFTIDEETGMTGAMGLQGGVLTGDILLNLDTEQDDEIDIGCAGGIDITAKLTYTPEPIKGQAVGYKLAVKGLHGGHSGMEIHKGLGNANKLLNRVLYRLMPYDIYLVEIDGGGLRNAIPRESWATLAILPQYEAAALSVIEDEVQAIKNELSTTEDGLDITCLSFELEKAKALPGLLRDQLIKAVYAAPNGVYRMSADFEGLVETSNNIARVVVRNGELVIKCLTRSSVESSKTDLANALKCCFELMGANVSFSGDYPGWTPKADSEILKVFQISYEELFQEQPSVVACHAGLECGILGKNYPAMDMISFGPTILGAHSPQERVSIRSVQKFWTLLTHVLQNIPLKTK
ncbi:aminoacyl-histidine dipeptidase [Sphingobacterium sp. LRF_L2]|uniref:aminoacyl-histidine dipeptidase n=1 Tax=Sphingobacterium sp. LRF_L2 TaxID=3369421 RepID=UPI003F6282B7